MTVEQMLTTARARLRRLSVVEARRRHQLGAVLVDIRPEAQRRESGEIPGSVVVERNVLEWRFDPASTARLAVAHRELEIVVFCQEGFTSSLAAASLLDLDLPRGTDMVGGFAAWRGAGFPTVAGGTPTGGTVRPRVPA